MAEVEPNFFKQQLPPRLPSGEKDPFADEVHISDPEIIKAGVSSYTVFKVTLKRAKVFLFFFFPAIFPAIFFIIYYY